MRQKTTFDFKFNRTEKAQLNFSEKKIKQEIFEIFGNKSFELSLKYLEATL